MEFDFCSVQVHVPEPASSEINWLGRTHIPPECLYEGDDIGCCPRMKTEDMHITIRYGLKPHHIEAVSQLAEGVGVIPINLIGLGVFHAEDYDVIYVGVDRLISMSRLRSRVEATIPDLEPSAHGRFVPHVTIAYVKKGFDALRMFRTWEMKIGNDRPNRFILASHLEFSDQHGNITPISTN